MSGYLRLSKPPELIINAPLCDACDVEVSFNGDGLLCPSCGSFWHEAEEGITGDLSEEATGPVCPNEYAWQISDLRGEVRDAVVQSFIEREQIQAGEK